MLWTGLTAIGSSIALLLLTGCGGFDQSPAGSTPDAADFQSHTTLIADWNDVDAAVELGASQSDMSFIKAWTNADGQRVCLLRTLRDETAWIIAERGPSGDPSGESATLTLRVQVGRFGNPESEARLLSNVRTRLRELQGVATYEIR